jgi:hypothetical protein
MSILHTAVNKARQQPSQYKIPLFVMALQCEKTCQKEEGCVAVEVIFLQIITAIFKL